MSGNPTASVAALLIYYSFDLHGYNAEELAMKWLDIYSSKWVVAAIVEALYQGRYKAESVAHLLDFWAGRGQVLHHFDYEFLDIVCRKVSQGMESQSLQQPQSPQRSLKITRVQRRKQRGDVASSAWNSAA